MVVPGVGAEVVWDDEGQRVTFEGGHMRAATREFVHLDRILDAQDAAGVDVVVLCPWINLAGRQCDRQNEVLASYVGDRVAALGTVDCDRPEQLEELMRDGRLSGVEIAAAPGGHYLGHERFEGFWSVAEETGSFVFIHPSSHGFAQPALQDYYLWNTLGNPTETAFTAAHMVVSGVLERHPDLVVTLAHGGGALPWLRGRLRRAYEVQPAARARLDEPPDVSLRRFYYDTVTHDVDVLRGVLDFAGADHVLCGSDYPFDMGSESPADIVRALGLEPREEERVLGENALELLGRKDKKRGVIDVDHEALRRSIELAWESRRKGNHPFGAVLADAHGRIVLEAENTAETEQDVCGHAELNLIRLASGRYSPAFLEQCTLYASAEPCVMCCGAIYAGSVRNVVYALSAREFARAKGNSRKALALKIPSAETFSHGQDAVTVSGPHLEEEALAPHEGYW